MMMDEWKTTTKTKAKEEDKYKWTTSGLLKFMIDDDINSRTIVNIRWDSYIGSMVVEQFLCGTLTQTQANWPLKAYPVIHL